MTRFFLPSIFDLCTQPEFYHRTVTWRLCGDGLFRSLCIIYGSSTATTLIPILSSIISDEDTTIEEKGILLGFYLPYLIFPIWLVSIAVCEQNVFGSETKKKE